MLWQFDHQGYERQSALWEIKGYAGPAGASVPCVEQGLHLLSSWKHPHPNTYLDEELNAICLSLKHVHLCQPVNGCCQNVAVRLLLIHPALLPHAQIHGQDEAAMPHSCVGELEAAVPAKNWARGDHGGKQLSLWREAHDTHSVCAKGVGLPLISSNRFSC